MQCSLHETDRFATMIMPRLKIGVNRKYRVMTTAIPRGERGQVFLSLVFVTIAV